MVQVGPYVLEAPLGDGGNGRVWLARPVGGGPAVALKRGRAGPGVGPRTRAEADAHRRFRHRRIVPALGVVADPELGPGAVAIAMPVLEHGSIADRMDLDGALAPVEVATVVADLASALAAIHAAGWTHGDVSAGNVLFDGKGGVVLGDLGSARPCGRAAGAGPSDDVAALGRLALMAGTGAAPPQRTDPAPVGWPAPLRALVADMCRPDPRTRPSAACAAARASLAVVEGAAMSAVTTPAPGRTDRSSSPRPPARPWRVLTDEWGPRPPVAQGAPPPAPRLRRWPMVLAGMAVLVAAVVLAISRVGPGQRPVRHGRVPRVATVTAEPPTTRWRAPSQRCADLARIPAPAGSTVLWGDLRGDGCQVQVVWDGAILQVRLDAGDERPRRYQVVAARTGRAGRGTLLLGDWDCDGRESPAHYDPAGGVVAYFGAIPDHGALAATRTDATVMARGRARVRPAGPGRCDRVAVTAPPH